MAERYAFIPNYATPPGDTLLETIETLGINQAELARRTGRPIKTINEIIQGKAALTHETALQLELVTGVPADLWSRLEANYRAFLARQDELESLESRGEWLGRFPYDEMVQRGWLGQGRVVGERIRELLGFFGVASIDAWEQTYDRPQAAFRLASAYASDPYALSAWLRKGELEAAGLKCAPFDRDQFTQVLGTIRSLTMEDPSRGMAQAAKLCQSAGVAVTVVPELLRSRVSGAARWLSTDKALVQLSLRYSVEDQIWFSFFHEAGHILKHGKRQVFLDSGDGSNQGDESEANVFAANTLIPSKLFASFVVRKKFTVSAVQAFADSVGVSPAIVVGRLQHEGLIPWKSLNGLKRRLGPPSRRKVAVK